MIGTLQVKCTGVMYTSYFFFIFLTIFLKVNYDVMITCVTIKSTMLTTYQNIYLSKYEKD